MIKSIKNICIRKINIGCVLGRKFFILANLLLFSTLGFGQPKTKSLLAQDNSVKEILQTVISTKQKLIRYEKSQGLDEKELLFMAIFDFDDTILWGDCTEGKRDVNGSVIYKGLTQVCIEKGLSKQYKTFAPFWTKYTEMEIADAPKAWIYAAQIFAGAKESKILEVVANYYKSTLSNYFFQSAIEIISGFKKEGIVSSIVSGSPQVFLKGAAPYLQILPENIHGMQTVVKDGILTDEAIYPLTTQEGKIEKIQLIIKEKLRDFKKVYILSGFGNNSLNDNPFIFWIADQEFPDGKPLGVMAYSPPRTKQKNISLVNMFEITADKK